MTELEQSVKSYFGIDAIDDLKTMVSLFITSTVKRGEVLLKSY